MEFKSIKEQMFQDKLKQLHAQLKALENGAHPEFLDRIRSLDFRHKESLDFAENCRQLELERIERDYINERAGAAKELEERKSELRESLIGDLEERRKQLDLEHQTMELP